MHHKLTHIIMISLMVLLVTASGSVAQADAPQAPLSPAFTYQGKLTDNGTPASGGYDFRFILYNADVGGSQVGSTLYKGTGDLNKGRVAVRVLFVLERNSISNSLFQRRIRCLLSSVTAFPL